MSGIETYPPNQLRVTDLGPLRRLLGSHSMVIRVDDDGEPTSFDMLPELFLGRTLRHVLKRQFRDEFDRACRRVVETCAAATYAPGADDSHEVMIAPVCDDTGERCVFLMVWVRGRTKAADRASVRWSDLHAEDIEVRFRANESGVIEASPWWTVGVEGIDLWAHHDWVSSVGLAATAMQTVIIEGVAAVVDHPDLSLRVDVPSGDMLQGLLQSFYGAVRSTGINPDRIEVGVPVQVAVDPDLLPLITHLRTFGLRVDIVGLDALTATLQKVSSPASGPGPAPTPPLQGEVYLWAPTIDEALHVATRNDRVEKDDPEAAIGR